MTDLADSFGVAVLPLWSKHKLGCPGGAPKCLFPGVGLLAIISAVRAVKGLLESGH